MATCSHLPRDGQEQVGNRYLPTRASHRAREENGKLTTMCLRPSLLRVR